MASLWSETVILLEDSTWGLYYSIMTTDYFVQRNAQGRRRLFAEHEQASLENSRRVSSWKSFIVFFSLTSPARSLEVGKVGGEF